MKNLKQQTQELLRQFQKEYPEVEELIHSDKTEKIAISKLIRPSYSSRVIISNLLKVLVKSLYENDFVGGIFINQNFEVIDGWHRVRIWESMGNDEIPCFILDIPKNLEKKLHLSLNRQISQFNITDFGLQENFQGLDLIKDFGFTKADLLEKDNPEEILIEDFEPISQNRKLITSISEEYYVKLDVIKKKLNVPNKSIALIKLIDFYEKSNS